ncbi:LacI family DNA-binding transcriptional regulator [Streptomyces sp. NPDC092296]|uniref:LacI family DNA-binding transcriptional regulator n=1 Tax=Streptomyces sp. NPDC092296 TaxID=3366012 RepID=UPI00382D9A9E
MKRPTMADIARRAGVTKAAVSFALNGRPGVSESTRRRILAIADELGWQPNSAARALSDGRAGAFGLVIDRPARTLGLEPFFMQLISGIQAELSADGTPLLLTVAEDQQAEIDTYRTWSGQRRVDGVFLVDMQVEDARVAVLEALGMPTVVIGAPIGTGRLPSVWSDDSAAAHTALQHLAALGHRRVARVCGPAHLRHTEIRSAAIDRLAPALGMECTTVATDYSADEGAAAARTLLTRHDPPTAILFDSDLTAVSGLTAAQSLGLRVPEDVSILGWGDSALCELVNPPLTALSRDIAAHGGHAARLLRLAATGARVADFQDEASRLVPRGSTGPAAAGAPAARPVRPASPAAPEPVRARPAAD